MNLPFLIGVEERKVSDCIIIEIPLKLMIKLIRLTDLIERVDESTFAPLVISIMPDIVPVSNAESILSTENIGLSILLRKSITFKLVKRSIKRAKIVI